MASIKNVIHLNLRLPVPLSLVPFWPWFSVIIYPLALLCQLSRVMQRNVQQVSTRSTILGFLPTLLTSCIGKKELNEHGHIVDKPLMFVFDLLLCRVSCLKIILFFWKNAPTPTLKMWISNMSETAYLEEMRLLLAGKADQFLLIWSPFIDLAYGATQP